MSKKLIYKIIAISACSFLILLIISIGFNIRLKSKLDLQETYIAKRKILPREKISEVDLLAVSLPRAYLQDYCYVQKEEIVGKYTDIQGSIPAGSLFYKSMLKEEKELPDNPTLQLKEGQAAYSMEVDLAKLGGTLVSGQRVDVYFSTITDELGISGPLILNCRIIAIKDHRGLDIEDEESSKTPYLAVLAVNVSDVSILDIAEKKGEIRLIASSLTYESDTEASLCTDETILNYLKNS